MRKNEFTAVTTASRVAASAKFFSSYLSPAASASASASAALIYSPSLPPSIYLPLRRLI